MLIFAGWCYDQHNTVALLSLKVASLNINGMNNVAKQMKLVTFMKSKSIDIACIQVHNIKSMEKLDYIMNYYNVILNKSVLFKGGTLIILDKKLPVDVIRTYMHPTSRICTAVIKVMDVYLYLVNVYARDASLAFLKPNSRNLAFFQWVWL